MDTLLLIGDNAHMSRLSRLPIAKDTGAPPWRILRWLARAASLASLALLAMFATTDGNAPSAWEWLLILFFPIGVAVGLVLAWFNEIRGGSLATLSLVALHLLMWSHDSQFWHGPWFLVFASPAIALLACGLATRDTSEALARSTLRH